MNRERIDRRKQKVRPLTAQQRRLYDAERALAGSDRGHDASKKIQGVYRAHLRKPVVYMKGRDLPQQDYARYANLRDFLRNQQSDQSQGGDGLYIQAAPPFTSKRMRYFQKVYAPGDREYILRSSNWDDIHEAAPASFLGLPPEWVPDATVTKNQVTEAINRRRRKLRDIEDGEILIRDALFRELPDRGRRWKGHKKPKLTHHSPFFSSPRTIFR